MLHRYILHVMYWSIRQIKAQFNILSLRSHDFIISHCQILKIFPMTWRRISVFLCWRPAVGGGRKAGWQGDGQRPRWPTFHHLTSLTFLLAPSLHHVKSSRAWGSEIGFMGWCRAPTLPDSHYPLLWDLSYILLPGTLLSLLHLRDQYVLHM